jgi:uncharacterized protein (TIGR02145 family)
MKSTKCFLAAVTIVALAFTFAAAQQKGTQKATPQGEAFYVPYPENLLAPYKKELRNVYIKIIKTARTPNIDRLFLANKDKLEELDFNDLATFILNELITIELGNYPSNYRQYASANKQISRSADAEFGRINEKYKSSIEANKIYQLPLYVSLNKAASELSAKQSKHVKGEFETTEQYNQRLKAEEQIIKNSSEAQLLKEITPIAHSIQNEINAFSLVFEKYDADKGIYTVSSDTTGWKAKHTGQVKISPEEASRLKNARDLKISVNPSDVYSVNYKLYVTKAEISYGDKKYIAEFPKANNMREIVFRGSELWKENSAAKGIELTFANAIAKLDEEKRQLYDVLADGRDGNKYNAIKIGSQVWMAENLNYDAEGSKCYGNKPENCKKYGRLYDWNTAKKVCPKGWHLPSDKEWQKLVDFAGDNKVAVTKLKAKISWNYNGSGTDDYGFAALPGGNGNSGGSFFNVGNNGNWWSATEDDANNAWDRNMGYGYIKVNRSNSYKSYLFSVRCVQD